MICTISTPRPATHGESLLVWIKNARPQRITNTSVNGGYHRSAPNLSDSLDEHTMVITCDIAVFEIPSSYMTVGSTKEIPQPPIPWVIHIIRNGTNVGLLNRVLICSRSNVFARIVGACFGRSAMIASLSSSERKLTV
jgi:hypothetical protein